MEAHGFALPGFRITKTCAPQWMGGYIVAEFNFTTYFGGPMTGKLFSGARDTSHILVRDCSGEPCLQGRLRVVKSSISGHSVHACGDLLRPSKAMERMFGGNSMVRRENIERAIQMGYSNFKNDMNMMIYVNLVMNAGKDWC